MSTPSHGLATLDLAQGGASIDTPFLTLVLVVFSNSSSQKPTSKHRPKVQFPPAAHSNRPNSSPHPHILLQRPSQQPIQAQQLGPLSPSPFSLFYSFFFTPQAHSHQPILLFLSFPNTSPQPTKQPILPSSFFSKHKPTAHSSPFSIFSFFPSAHGPLTFRPTPPHSLLLPPQLPCTNTTMTTITFTATHHHSYYPSPPH